MAALRNIFAVVCSIFLSFLA